MGTLIRIYDKEKLYVKYHVGFCTEWDLVLVYYNPGIIMALFKEVLYIWNHGDMVAHFWVIHKIVPVQNVFTHDIYSKYTIHYSF